MNNNNNNNKSKLDSFLSLIERWGDNLPNPFTLFLFLFLGSVFMAHLLYIYKVGSHIPGVDSKTLFSPEGLEWFLTTLPYNFINFPPLPIILLITCSLGVASSSGFIDFLFRVSFKKINGPLLIFLTLFISLISSVASSSACILLPPLAAIAFIKQKKSPILGILLAFAGASGGFTANLFISSTDLILSATTNEILAGLEVAPPISVLGNWYFMGISTLVIAITGTIVTVFLVEPRVNRIEIVEEGKRHLDLKGRFITKDYLGAFAALTFTICFIVFLIFIYKLFPGSPFHPPLIVKGITTLFFIFFIGLGCSFGFVSGHFTSLDDIFISFKKSFVEVTPLLALLLVASQFIAFFSWSGIDKLIALEAGQFLMSSGTSGFVTLVIFICLTAIVNIFIGSGSTKWVLLAPIYLPLLTGLGYSPALTQLIYRIGDSATNIVSPISIYLPIILGFTQKYQSKIGLGRLIALLLPYTITFLLTWIVLLGIWVLFSLPIGPDTFIYL